jgi:RNA polymerase sigma factor (sigma-70 family)
VGDWVPGTAASPAQAALFRCLRDDNELLLDSIRVYVRRFGLAAADDARSVALEVLQEITVEALEHAERFAPDRRPIPWLLGIALNVLRRRKAEQARQGLRERWTSAVRSPGDELGAQADVFERIGAASSVDELAEVEAEDAAERLLALVSVADQEIVRLAVIKGWNSEELARRLGTKPGTARVRLHRALGRLRSAWLACDAAVQKENAHG